MTIPLTARWVVVDIEGTVTATKQVHGVLYDYARPRLGAWIDDHPDDAEVAGAVRQVRELAGLPDTATTAEVVAVLHEWMDADRKAAPLKTLQGLVWQHGYAHGELTIALFPDVAPALRSWHEAGVSLAVFSSGSVAAQVALFANTTDGDLTALFSGYFDTVNAGPKRETVAYERIAERLGAAAEDLAFLSDVPAELDAAAAVGWRVVGLARPGEPFADADFGPHPTTDSLTRLQVVVPQP
ncbi:acireductone synthase [Streptoalloteichus hindustanus]|uniref:Enolase-phosphatase E1 n=1 Tax=Streptoalloteichus hindustanus TaxID=2017 RepID=A0A1M5N730_STRHI|nr:acireductone synthase [Streptoalloteichus hindustanus]SHG85380.1 acireductone synthase [Streptoalloteichus hindustanus]